MNTACVAALLLAAHLADAETIELRCSKDNTLMEDPIGETGAGAGDGIFSGRTGSSGSGIRRALVQFNLSEIPTHATITSVQLSLTLIKSNTGTHTHTVHRMLNSWGEGPTYTFGGSGAPIEPGDTSWLYRFFPGVFWTTPGGEFVAGASASRTIGSTLTTYTWPNTNGMINDVRYWLDHPSENYGWMIRGNESVLKTAKKFAAKETISPVQGPRLIIVYTPPPPCTADPYPLPEGNGLVDMDDLLYVINNWGEIGAPGSFPPDITGNGVVDIDDLLAVINQWGSCP